MTISTRLRMSHFAPFILAIIATSASSRSILPCKGSLATCSSAKNPRGPLPKLSGMYILSYYYYVFIIIHYFVYFLWKLIGLKLYLFFSIYLWSYLKITQFKFLCSSKVISILYKSRFKTNQMIELTKRLLEGLICIYLNVQYFFLFLFIGVLFIGSTRSSSRLLSR